MNKEVLNVKSATYTVDDNKNIVEDISFQVYSGELVSIIGPNGSGKSTLIKLISGELSLSDGTISVLGKQVNEWDLIQIANHRSVLSQSNSLTFPFSVLNIVKMGRYPIQTNNSSEIEEEICLEILDKFDLSGHVNQNYMTLSGGEKQRVQLARVFAQIYSMESYKEKLLLLDEPTSYLDIKHQNILFNLLKSMNKKGLTIIMVLHDLNHAVLYSEKIIMLKESKLMSFGNIDDVINEETLSKVFDISLKLIRSKETKKPIILNLN